MDKDKQYAPFSIPPRETGRGAGKPSPGPAGYPDRRLSDDAPFAEVEVGAGAAGRAYGQASPPAQPVNQRAGDPIRQIFYAMRSITPGGISDRFDAALFYRQAKFMQKFSDEYDGQEPFSLRCPNYHQMSYAQLRTYFTWRGKVRRGEYLPIPLSYILLYIFELLANVGVKGHADGLDRLLAVWQAYREQEPALDRYLPRWIRDYHIYYPLPLRFADFVAKHSLRSFYGEMFLFSAVAGDSLKQWNRISSYNVEKSRFYLDGHDALFGECFCRVLEAVRKLCADRGIRFMELFQQNTNVRQYWAPFRQALFYPWRRQQDRQIILPGGAVYICSQGYWSVKQPMHYAGWTRLAGYIVKKTEACLRRAMKYKYKITVDHGMIRQSLPRLKRYGITSAGLDDAIEAAVDGFYREATRTVVTVDQANLARIREEALGTQNRLIVPEDEAAAAGELIREAAPAAPDDPRPAEPPPAMDGWAALREALRADEREALALILNGGGIKAFADAKGVMLEVLADGINDKAADLIGDALLDTGGGMEIYEEYREEVRGMIE